MQVSINIGNVPAEPPRPERFLPPTVKEQPDHWATPETVVIDPQPEAAPVPAEK